MNKRILQWVSLGVIVLVLAGGLLFWLLRPGKGPGAGEESLVQNSSPSEESLVKREESTEPLPDLINLGKAVASTVWVNNSPGGQKAMAIWADETVGRDPNRPVLKITDKKQFDSFYDRMESEFTFTVFQQKAKEYTEDFFQRRGLILFYRQANKGSIRYEVKEAQYGGEMLAVKIQTTNGEIGTFDMSGYFIIIEVDQDILKNIKKVEVSSERGLF